MEERMTFGLENIVGPSEDLIRAAHGLDTVPVTDRELFDTAFQSLKDFCWIDFTDAINSSATTDYMEAVADEDNTIREEIESAAAALYFEANKVAVSGVMRVLSRGRTEEPERELVDAFGLDLDEQLRRTPPASILTSTSLTMEAADDQDGKIDAAVYDLTARRMWRVLCSSPDLDRYKLYIEEPTAV
jgi:hypothetical protein